MQNERYFLAQLLYRVSRIISQEMKQDESMFTYLGLTGQGTQPIGHDIVGNGPRAICIRWNI